MDKFLEGLKEATNYKYTENGAGAYKSTLNKVLDMFALGGAYRNRSDDDCIKLFQDAWREDPNLALKCLFYIRDCRGGQGERRFFRVVMRYIMEHAYGRPAFNHLIPLIPEYGRWDDLFYITYKTQAWDDAMSVVRTTLLIDLHDCDSPNYAISVLGKWMPSCNASSATTREMGNAVRAALGYTHRKYRKTLKRLRARLKVLETLMSAKRWDEIQFDTIPSKAGLKYRNAFARNEYLAARYGNFMKDQKTKVNASVLNPVDIAKECLYCENTPDAVERLALQKYWDNLPDYYGGRKENGICIVDVSGSMEGTPMAAAVSLGAYIANKAEGPFKNHFITFSSNPDLVEFSGQDIYAKFRYARNAHWGNSTNLKAAMELILNTAIKTHSPVPERLYIFSDMEFDAACGHYSWNSRHGDGWQNSLFNIIEAKFKMAGYKMPHIVFWNLDARNNTIPAVYGRYSYVSGFNPNMIECILSGKTGWDLCLEKLLSPRYKNVHVW